MTFTKLISGFPACLLITCALGLLSCTPAPIAEPATSADNTLPAVEVLQELDQLPLSQLAITLENGIPKYTSTSKFLQVHKAISWASEAAYLSWSERQGYQSPYHDYLKLAERIEANPEIPSQEQISKREGQFIMHYSDGGIVMNPYLPVPKLTDQEGRLYIGDDLHSFSADHHILIDGGTPAQLEAVLANPIADLEKGILVQPITELSNPYERTASTEGEEKVQIESFDCPFLFSSSLDPLTNFFSFWSAPQAKAAIRRSDEQRVGCSRRRCRRTTDAILLSNTFTSQVNPNSFEAVSILRFFINNRRRNRFNWTRTFPTMVVDNGPEQEQMRVRLQAFVATSTNQLLPRLDIVRNIDYPGQLLEPNGSPRGSAEEDLALESVGITTFIGVGNAVGFDSFQTIVGGDVRHRWTSGSNNPTTDPISVTFNCR